MTRSLRQDYRILRLKAVVIGLISFGVGTALLVVTRSVADLPAWEWLSFWPLGEIGGILIGAGVLGIAWDYLDGRDREARDDARLRRLLKEAAPYFRDAVVAGFAVESDDLKRVATPSLLDSIAGNVLGIRLGDAGFAREIYGDLIDNVIRAPERWHDVNVRVRLSSCPDDAPGPVPRFVVLVTWEYSVVPRSAVRRFTCTSDREEFHDLISDVPSTSTWFMTPHLGFDPSSREAFELVQFSVDGVDRPIRRNVRKASQTYSVHIDDVTVSGIRPVRIRHVYRTITAKHGHLLMLSVAQPAKGMTMTVDYTDTDIASMRVSDHVTSAGRPRLFQLPGHRAAREITMDVPGWLLPQTEVTFVWTLSSELPITDAETVSGSRVA